MIIDNIKRIEEIRYLISKKTFELMKTKITDSSNTQKLRDLEEEINLLKQELSNHLSVIQDAGYVYIFVNKNEINKLRQEFSKLSDSERMDAFREIGKGYELLSKSNSILKRNYELRDSIATLILSLPADEKIVHTIKNYLEGYSDGGSFALENRLAASRISDLISSLGFSSTSRDEIVYLGNSINQVEQKKSDEEIVKNIFPIESSDFVSSNQEAVNVANEVSSENKQPLQIVDKEALEIEDEEIKEIKPIAASEISKIDKSDEKSNEKSDETSKEISKETSKEKISISSEDLQPNLTYEEVCQKIEEIMNNYKMKRWVLGAFKDEKERKQYEKIQSLLIKLMRLKKSMEEKGEK